MPTTASAYAGFSPDTPLAPHTIERRDPGPKDVAIDVLFCGICHSDLHFVKNEWGIATYPCVPGHEIIGRVSAVGSDVRNVSEGDMVGVGCLVDSCRSCASCGEDLQQYCTGGFTMTYGSPDPHLGGVTFGGYSSAIVVDQDFVLRIPNSLDPAGAAPLLCAGITTWSPLKHWKVGKGSRVGVVGLGGLGHVGVKLAAALGAEVVVFTTSPAKSDEARKLGALDVVVSTDPDDMSRYAGQLNFIMNTVAAPHSLDALLACLARDGTMCLLGIPQAPHPSPAVMPLVFGRRTLAGSLIGGIRETQEMLDFCGEHGIVADIEKVRIDEVNTAFERMLQSDVRYRFVIDMNS